MIRYTTLSIIFLALAFTFFFSGSFFKLPFTNYFSTICFIFSLALYKKNTPNIFFLVTIISLFLTLASPSPYLTAALIPLAGYFFSGQNRFHEKIKVVPRYVLLITICGFYLITMLLSFKYSTASHNIMSEILVFAIIAELLFFGRPSKWYILLIAISFFTFGNRSSLFLLLAFIKNKLLLIPTLIAMIGSVALVLKLLEPPLGLDFLFKEGGGVLYRSYPETRGDYLNEFLTNFNMFDLRFDGWNFIDVPQTGDGFYDLHNSFLTVIVRDAYLGIFKVLLWAVQIFLMPLGIFLGITLRAGHDSFLLGGTGDILLNAFIGNSLIEGFKKIGKYLYAGGSKN